MLKKIKLKKSSTWEVPTVKVTKWFSWISVKDNALLNSSRLYLLHLSN